MALTKIPASLLDTTAGLSVAGDLNVSGTTTTLNSTTLQVVDKNIVLNYHASNDTSSTANGAGITIQDAVDSSNDATILWDATNDEFDFSHQATLPGLKLGVNTSLFNQDAAISYYASNNGVYVNGAGTNGWLRLNASGAENARNSIDLYGQAGGDYIKVKAANTDTMYIGAGGAGRVGIGTSNASHALHVVGGDNDEARIRVHNSASGQASFDLDNSEGYFRMFTDAGEWRLYDQTDGAYRMRIDTSGNVAIGPQSPTHQLHIKGPASAYAAMRIESASTSHGAIINLSDSTDDDYGQIVQFASSAGEGGRMRFIAGGTETLNLRGGKVGIGIGSPSEMLHILGGGNGPEIRLQNSSSSHYIRAYDDNWNFLANASNTAMTIRNSGQVDFGAGLGIGGTGSANTLDDYERGTYTAAITCASGSITLYSGYDTLAYTKVGRIVHIQGKITVNTQSSPTGATTINLPFTINNLNDRAGFCTHVGLGYFNGSAISSGFHTIYMEGVEGTAYIRPYVMKPSSTAGNAPSTSNLGDNNMAQGSDIYLNFTYIAG